MEKDQRLTRQQKQHLVSGFIRDNFSMTKMPISLIKMIQNIHDEIVYWKIKGNEMETFGNCSINDALKGPIFSLSLNTNADLIAIQCMLYPSGNAYVYRTGFVESYLACVKLSENIKSIVVYMILSSQNPHYEFKHTAIFRKNGDSRCWSCAAVRRQDCMQYKQLEFGYYAKLLHIEYQDNIQREDTFDIETITMDPYSEYEWNLSGDELKRIQNGKTGQHFYSPNFNGSGCFCIYCSPKGWHAGNINTFSFQVKLLKLPQEMASIEMDICLKCDELNGFKWITRDKQMSYITPRSGWPNGADFFFESDKFNQLMSISLKVILKIKDNSVFKLFSPYYTFTPTT